MTSRVHQRDAFARFRFFSFRTSLIMIRIDPCVVYLFLQQDPQGFFGIHFIGAQLKSRSFFSLDDMTVNSVGNANIFESTTIIITIFCCVRHWQDSPSKSSQHVHQIVE